jgi:hypothetical protein
MTLARRSLLLGVAGFFSTGSALGKDRTTRVRFKAGKSQASFSGHLVNDDAHTYSFEAKKGQQLSIKLSADTDDLEYSVIDQTTQEQLLITGELSAAIPSTGAFDFNVWIHRWKDFENSRYERNYKLVLEIS